MSLFPAYAEQAKVLEAEDASKEKQNWLENSSYTVDVIGEQISSASSSCNEEPRAKVRRKKEKRKHKKQKQKPKKQDEIAETTVECEKFDGFVIDTKPVLEYNKVKTISRPAVSKYRVTYRFNHIRKPKKRKFKRYFKIILEKSDTEQQVLTKQNIDKTGLAERDENFAAFKEEEDLSKTTAYYNQKLTDDPNDVSLWLKYVEFQDTVYQFEKSYRKGSIAKAQRVLAERKIAILEKALGYNPNCEVLLRERINVAVSGFPADELQAQLKKLVEKDQGNIILWQGYIEASQCSMSHCNTPAVISLYSKCLSTLHQLRRSSTMEKHLLEESILRMLYQCGLFLKQAGLFEQLWTLLKMYLELNLSPTDKTRFDIAGNFNEKQLVELEEVVLQSQLPHHELWLRLEKLKESCHWLPASDGEECEDPQRMVFAEDVVELIHPITMPENVFKLVATILALLKVPLLPCRHCTMQDLGLDYVPWSLDSVESILPVFMPLFPVDTVCENLLKDTTNRLTVGPQYLKSIPGQEEYLNFVLNLLESCSECLSDKNQTALRIWWFRFQRLLLILAKRGNFKPPKDFNKKTKTNIKSFLKREAHRTNIAYYIEYALIEKEMGNVETCKKVLETTLNTIDHSNMVSKDWDDSQANRCHLYRNLVEVSHSSKSLEYLVKLVLQRDFSKLTNGILMEADTKFKSLSHKLVDNFSGKKPLEEHLLPDFFTDWIICHCWFIYHYKGCTESCTFMDTTLKSLKDNSNDSTWHREVLSEFYCALLFKNCLEVPETSIFKTLDGVLFAAIEEFPNNLYLLTILAKQQSLLKNVGVEWWRIQKMLLKSGRAFATIFATIVHDLVRLEVERDLKDTITGDSYEVTVSYKNRMFSLFKKITKSDMCTRRCGLAWRLFLQFVHTFFSPNVCRNIYYSAVEECPWLKALYMDAAIYIPAELAQIQDLIIEKQLRLHVTPEELDILRT